MESISEKISSFIELSNGNGSGNGSDNGYGYGSGNGYGYGIKEINGWSIYNVDGVQTIITHIHGSIAEGYIVKCNVYLEHCYIAKGQGYFAHGETVRAACDALEEKIIANLDTDARIAKFKSKFALDRKYPATDFYKWHSVLTGSCEQGRRAFAEEHGIDIETAEYTVEEFINMTKNSFGEKIIQQLADELGMR